ncbi:hypothetical protein [Orenia marismortui]|uniref:Uncharacterized protein n=1 Tax=Orenia marismortui TaxID=46469 RepID=A0A4R8GR52_9FIRM|nr:hypothetical protein [Orenia marismortui]TDX48316.1 hypothetical protein C7959_13043 [Orenia marismortui]
MSTKIEQAKKKLGNLWLNKQITDQEYRQAMNELDEKAKELKAQSVNNSMSIRNELKRDTTKREPVAPLNVTKKDKMVEEALEYKGVDLEHYINPILILFRVGDNQSLEKLAKGFSHKSSFTLLIELFHLCNSAGEVEGFSRDRLVADYGYKNGEAAYRAINELEESDIIEVDRSVKPNRYIIKNYAENMKTGGFVVSRDTMVEEAKNLLKKDYRAFFYNCFRRQHSPVNDKKKNSKLSTLKDYINAGSCEEVMRIYERLEGKLLESAKIVTDRFKKADNLVKFVYDKVKMRIIETKEEVVDQVTSHWFYDSLKNIYKLIGIKLTINNLKQGFRLIEQYGERCLKAVQYNLHKFDKSTTGRVGYFEFMLNQARIGAII